jgi:hypothetical protein
MPTSGSRAEFLAVDELGTPADIKYARTGGCFVSTKKGILLGLIVISAMVMVGISVYYLTTCKGGKLVKLQCVYQMSLSMFNCVRSEATFIQTVK